MDIKRVDHYSIRTRDLERSQRFYTEVIGLNAGPRPPFDFPGYWLYSGEPPADLHNSARNYGLVHLMGWNPDKPGTLDAYVGARPDAVLELLGLIQVFIKDPDGVTLELNFPASEAPAASAGRATATAR